MGKLSLIDKDDLKVGDVVGVVREVRCGWGTSFRHVFVYPAKIIRITPKRTKIETDKFGEHDKHEVFYKYDSEAIKESEMAKKFKEIKDAVNLVRTFAKYPDRTALTDSFIKSLKLLADTVESQMKEVK